MLAFLADLVCGRLWPLALSLVLVCQNPMLGSEVYKLKGEEIAAEKTQVVTLGGVPGTVGLVQL